MPIHKELNTVNWLKTVNSFAGIAKQPKGRILWAVLLMVKMFLNFQYLL